MRIIDLFRDWDDDGDGKVSKTDLSQAPTLTRTLTRTLPLTPTLALTLTLTLT